jgi:hypothetical protein
MEPRPEARKLTDKERGGCFKAAVVLIVALFVIGYAIYAFIRA